MITKRLRRGGIALGAALALFSSSGCVPHEPLIPENVHSQIQADDRMRNYDLAWQEIRALNVEINQGDVTEVTEQALVVIARMHRLGEGSPSRLRDRKTWQFLEQEASQATLRDASRNNAALADAGMALQQTFDDGDFQPAKESALRVYAISVHLGEQD